MKQISVITFRHFLMLFSLFFVLGCSKDDIYGYSIPKSFLGVWESGPFELSGGEVVRELQYVFSLNNIHEGMYGGGLPDSIIDFNEDFPTSDWEIQESFELGRYEILFTPKNENALTPWGTNHPFQRAFIYTAYNGQESIMVDYAGFNGLLLFRKSK